MALQTHAARAGALPWFALAAPRPLSVIILHGRLTQLVAALPAL